MRKFLITILTMILTLLLLAGAGMGFYFYQKFSPSNERADLEKWFEVSGDEIAIIYNNERLEETKGIYKDGTVYLPQAWVSEELNERFYWDGANSQIIYALPEEIRYFPADEAKNGRTPDVAMWDKSVWLSADLVLEYTNVRIERYADGETKRVFVDTIWDTADAADLKKDAKVRTRGGVKSAILVDAARGETVEILEMLENWARVRTESGCIGYVQSKLLINEREVQRISSFQEPVYTSISMEDPVVMVWHQTMTEAANQTMEELMAGTDGVNVIAPTWFMLTANDGSYDSLADSAYVEKAHELGIQVWAVVDNFNRGDAVQSDILFADTQARQKLITDLIAEVREYGIDGINLDIEGIPRAAGEHYVQFIRELSVDCRKNGIVLSVNTYVPSAYTAFYNRAEQGRVADYVVIMGYDEHYAGGEAGSVASLGYERQGIEDTLKEVPADKVISAIPFYTRVWNVSSDGTTSTAMGISAAKSWVEEHGMELYWQEELGQYYGELATTDGTYYLWMEEERSIAAKMELIEQYGLAGVSCWKLGFEPPEIWEIVRLEGSSR
ncbi:MAG: glycosyl hydrolase family 18 protein [Clostridiales bacterium]|nr:glycosyl hydrolase family 18 protein [Clostridiales bacterium]